MADYIEKQNAEVEESGGFQLKELWTIVVLNWQWIAISAFIALCLAFAYLRYTHPVYSSSMKILIKDEDKKKFANGQMSLENMGLISNSNGFDNELEILRSTSISTRVVKKLKLYVRYYIQGRIRKSELYKDSPIIIDMPEQELNELECRIGLKITKADQKYNVEGRIYVPGEEDPIEFSHEVTSLPSTISTPAGTVMLQPNPGYEMDEHTLYASIVPPVAAGRACVKSLSAAATSKTTTVANVSYLDTNRERAIDYLTELMNSYNEDANEDKNEVAMKTEEFIKERLDTIRGELDMTEGELETYKKNNELVNLANDATDALTNINDYRKQQTELQTQINIVNGLINWMSKPNNMQDVIPANLGINDANLNKMISDYNGFVLQRNRLLKSSSEEHTYVQRLTAQIEEMWPSIKMSVEAIKEDLDMQKRSIDKQYNRFSGRIGSTPTQERVLNNFTRQQEIKAGLYLMLLQKREENFISLASTAAKARIIDAPQYNGKVSPKSQLIMLAALILGLGFPIGIIYLRNLLRFRIEGRDDLDKLTKIPVLADIPMASRDKDSERALVVQENSNDMMEEAFRGLRTNLRFVLEGGKKVIAGTSCIPGEGKTFVTTNLAMSLALMGKHVIVVGLDIRKPRLVRLFNLPSNKKGITTYLSSTEQGYELLEEQIFHGVGNKNLDVLPAGVIPPNPSELISREQLDRAINHLREHYDYVLLDTPPVGLVSDTLSIGRTADITMFVCRADYTPRSSFELINSLKEEEKLPNVNLVLNGMDLKKKKYGYYYGYGKYGKYGKYGRYGYGKYGKYGIYGHYGKSDGGTEHTEK